MSHGGGIVTSVLEIAKFLVGVPVLAFLLYVPGAVLLNVCLQRWARRPPFSDRAEWLYTAILISFLLSGGLGLVLAETGLFRSWLLFAVITVLCLALALSTGRAYRHPRALLLLLRWPATTPQRAAESRMARLHTIGLGMLVLVAAGLFARPAEMLRGALDSGVYVNAGVSLGRTGAIFQRDTLMRELNNDTGEVNELMQGMSRDRYALDRLRMSGFYVLDKKAALVMPQHYSLFPVWIGLLYSLFGIWGGLYASPVLALLGVLSVFFFARRAFSSGAALLGTTLLVLCPVTIWFARYPVSETIMGVLVFSSCFAFLRMVQLTRDPPLSLPIGTRGAAIPTTAEADGRGPWASLFGLVAGVAFGEMALARPDFIFYLAPLPLYFIYWRLTRRWKPAYMWLLAGLLATLAIYVVHLSFYGFAYTLDVYHNVIQNTRRLWGPLLIALYGGVALLFALDRLYPRLHPFWVRVENLGTRYRWAWVGLIALAIGGYAVYNYAIGPWLPNLREDNAGNPLKQEVFTTWASYIGAPVDLGSRYNLLRIGWYLSPPGMILGVLGLLRWVWNRLNAGTALFLAMLAILSYVFIQETYTEAHYIYTMRRYMPIILPALLMGVAWSCQFLWSRVRPRVLGTTLAALLALGLGVFFIYTSRTIIQHVEEGGAVAQLNDLASRFKNPAKTVVLFSDGRDEPNLVSTPLQFIYGIESFVLVRGYPDINSPIIEKIVQRWQKDGYEVYIMMGANGGKVHFNSLSLKEVGSWQYAVPEFEQLYYQKPYNVSSAYLPWGIYSVQPVAAQPPALPWAVNIGEMDYPALVAGFNKQETADNGKTYWRWTGDNATLRVPVPANPDGKTYAGARVTLRLRPETIVTGQAPIRTEPLTITLHLDDTQLASIVVPPGTDFTDYTVTVPRGTPKKEHDPSTGLLRMESPTWSGKKAGLGNDNRALGVQVDRVKVDK